MKRNAASKWLLVAFFLMSACQPSAEDLVTQAEGDALNQRSELARHLFMQVIRGHTSQDDTRKRALLGIVDLALNQLHDYRLALQMTDLVIQEYGEKDLLRDLRFRAGRAARLQLQSPERALRYLEPVLGLQDLSLEETQEIGRTLGALRRFEESESMISKAWASALSSKNCELSKQLQMDLMQVLTLQKKCPEGIDVGKKKLFEGCRSDLYSINLELAHCYEFEGEPQEAIRIYEDMLKEFPQNTRVQFLLAQVKKRQKERQIK